MPNDARHRPRPHPAEDAVAADFRDAMRALAKGVIIVTARDERGRHAMAATAMTPLAMEPPSLLLCVNKTASIAPALRAGALMGVSVLGQHHDALSAACAGAEKGEARFQTGAWAEGVGGVPVVADALASVSCRIVYVSQYGTHAIVVGDVLASRSEIAGEPLVYFNGAYHGLNAEVTA